MTSSVRLLNTTGQLLSSSEWLLNALPSDCCFLGWLTTCWLLTDCWPLYCLSAEYLFRLNDDYVWPFFFPDWLSSDYCWVYLSWLLATFDWFFYDCYRQSAEYFFWLLTNTGWLPPTSNWFFYDCYRLTVDLCLLSTFNDWMTTIFDLFFTTDCRLTIAEYFSWLLATSGWRLLLTDFLNDCYRLSAEYFFWLLTATGWLPPTSNWCFYDCYRLAVDHHAVCLLIIFSDHLPSGLLTTTRWLPTTFDWFFYDCYRLTIDHYTMLSVCWVSFRTVDYYWMTTAFDWFFTTATVWLTVDHYRLSVCWVPFLTVDYYWMTTDYFWLIVDCYRLTELLADYWLLTSDWLLIATVWPLTTLYWLTTDCYRLTGWLLLADHFWINIV
jgi:hypothetical protein